MSHVQDTSLLSWMDLQPTLGERHTVVYRALQEIGPATDQELTQHVGRADPNYVRPRRRDLCNPKKFNPPLVVEVQKRTCTVTGKTVIAWGIAKQRW